MVRVTLYCGRLTETRPLLFHAHLLVVRTLHQRLHNSSDSLFMGALNLRFPSALMLLACIGGQRLTHVTWYISTARWCSFHARYTALALLQWSLACIVIDPDTHRWMYNKGQIQNLPEQPHHLARSSRPLTLDCVRHWLSTDSHHLTVNPGRS